MPETSTQSKTGTGVASPEPTKIKWCSMEEAERFEKMLLKNYIKKGDDKDSKKFFYKIIGSHPTVPSGAIGNTEEFLLVFEVQKYWRNKFTSTTVRDPQNPQVSNEAKINLQVDSHELRDGRWVCVDPEASFFMDAREFKEKFVPDTME
jgi:hypothetical protein